MFEISPINQEMIDFCVEVNQLQQTTPLASESKQRLNSIKNEVFSRIRNNEDFVPEVFLAFKVAVDTLTKIGGIPEENLKQSASSLQSTVNLMKSNLLFVSPVAFKQASFQLDEQKKQMRQELAKEIGRLESELMKMEISEVGFLEKKDALMSLLDKFDATEEKIKHFTILPDASIEFWMQTLMKLKSKLLFYIESIE